MRYAATQSNSEGICFPPIGIQFDGRFARCQRQISGTRLQLGFTLLHQRVILALSVHAPGHPPNICRTRPLSQVMSLAA
jgi:hypothetical protein